MTAAAPLFSRPVSVAEITPGGLALSVTPTPAERAALAAFNGLVAIKAMSASLRLRQEGTGVRVAGEVVAEVVQTCVISMEPFEAAVSEPIDVHFVSAETLDALRAARAARPVDDDENSPDEPDAIEHGRIDVGLLLAEHLTLGLDPYPKKPGAVLAPTAAGEEPAASPFAVLRRLSEERS